MATDRADRPPHHADAQERTAPIVAVGVLRCIQRQEDPSWRIAKGGIPALDGLIVVLWDEFGRRGEGHIECMGFYADTLEGSEAALDELRPALLGQSPAGIEALLAAMDRRLHGHEAVKAGVDCALHELLAVQLGVPLNVLFGGRRHDVLPLQRILPIKAPEAMAADAARLVARGYRCLKVKIDADGDLAVARTGAVRRQVGDAVRLSVDANQAYTAKTFLPVLKALERLGVDLVEQPVRAQDWSGLHFLRGRADVAIEADESAQTLADVLSLIAAKACDSFNLKVMRLGGLRNTLVAARICDAAHVDYRIGTAYGPRLIAAQSAHLAASTGRICYPLEFAEFDHLLDDPYTGLEIENGVLPVPRGVGCGLTRRAPLEPPIS